MTVPVFVDTNVLVYARDAAQPEKQSRAAQWLEHLWSSRQGRLSFQVLDEYYVTVTRKLRPGLAPEEARQEVRDLLAWRPVVIDAGVVQGAWTAQDRYGFSFWDALIVSAAQVAGCDHLLTEDLSHGQQLDGLEVVSPFAAPPGPLPGAIL
jgi:predicted nucleic acid-binding protein